MTIQTKTCSACGNTKPLDQYGKRKASKDGLSAACTECLKARDRDRYSMEKPKRLAAQKAYMQTPKGKVAHALAVQNYRKMNATRHAAHVILNNAVRDGRVAPWPACAAMNCECSEVEAHHPDYDRPLDVMWLCKLHHQEIHRSMSSMRIEAEKRAATPEQAKVLQSRRVKLVEQLTPMEAFICDEAFKHMRPSAQAASNKMVLSLRLRIARIDEQLIDHKPKEDR